MEGDVDLEKVNMVLGAIVDMRGEDIYRMKGILAIKGWKERFVFQVQTHEMHLYRNRLVRSGCPYAV